MFQAFAQMLLGLATHVHYARNNIIYIRQLCPNPTPNSQKAVIIGI